MRVSFIILTLFWIIITILVAIIAEKRGAYLARETDPVAKQYYLRIKAESSNPHIRDNTYDISLKIGQDDFKIIHLKNGIRVRVELSEEIK